MKDPNEFRPASPKDAAAVIIVRGDEILWARRNPNIKFLGGFHAFPGGKTDRGDAEIAVASCNDAEMSALLVCAVREVFEEVGVLLVRGGERLTKGQRASLHDDLISGRSSFAEILEQWGLWIDAEDFLYTGHWTTPQFSPVRFKTRFFIAQCPPRQTPYAAISELEAIEFISPASALERWSASEVLISPPVLISLQELAAAQPDPNWQTIAADSLRERSAAVDGEIDYIELNPRVLCFPLRTKTLPPATHTNCFVLGKKRFAVIDAASPYEDEQAKMLGLIDQYIDRGWRCEMIVVTHRHNDHFGGETVLQRHLLETHGLKVPIAGHPITAEDLRGKVEFQKFLTDGDVIDLEDGNGAGHGFEVLHTPGHARGHLAFYDREFGFLLTSDNVLGAGSVVIAHPEGVMTDYLDSLERMRSLPGLRFLAGSHGAAVFDAVKKIDGYIAHRLHREDSIRNALESGAKTAEEIAAIVYDGLDSDLFPLAVRTVEAHLVRIRAAE